MKRSAVCGILVLLVSSVSLADSSIYMLMRSLGVYTPDLSQKVGAPSSVGIKVASNDLWEDVCLPAYRHLASVEQSRRVRIPMTPGGWAFSGPAIPYSFDGVPKRSSTNPPFAIIPAAPHASIPSSSYAISRSHNLNTTNAMFFFAYCLTTAVFMSAR